MGEFARHSPWRPALVSLLLAARAAVVAAHTGDQGPPSALRKFQGAESSKDDTHEIILRDLANEEKQEEEEEEEETQDDDDEREEEKDDESEGQVPELFSASCQGDLAKVKKMLADGADVNGTGPFTVESDRPPVQDVTSLMCTAFGDNVELAKVLLDHGANMEAKDGDGQTALMYASSFGAVGLAEELLQHGASVHARDSDGMTALMLAATDYYDDDAEMVRLLLKNEADANLQDAKEEQTALMWAAQYGCTEAGLVLVNHMRGCEGCLDIQDARGDTALMIVVGLYTEFDDYYKLAKALLESNADPMLLNVEFVSPADQMLTVRDEELTTLFRAHYAPPRDLLESIVIAFGPSAWRESVWSLAIALPLGVLFAALVFWALQRCAGCCGGGGEEGDDKAGGAYDMAAMALRGRGRMPVLLKFVRMVEILGGLAFPFGPLLHIARWQVVVPLWLLLWVLPAGVTYREKVVAHPVLMMAPLRLRQRSNLGKWLSAVRMGLLIFLFALVAMTLDWEWYHQGNVKVSFTFENLRVEELSRNAKDTLIDTVQDKWASFASVEKGKVIVELASDGFMAVTAAIFTDAPQTLKKSLQINSPQFVQDIQDTLRGLESFKNLSTGGFTIPHREVTISTDHPIQPGYDVFWTGKLSSVLVSTNHSIIRTDFFWSAAPVRIIRWEVGPCIDCFNLFCKAEVCIVLCALVAILLPWQPLFPKPKDYSQHQVKKLAELIWDARGNGPWTFRIDQLNEGSAPELVQVAVARQHEASEVTVAGQHDASEVTVAGQHEASEVAVDGQHEAIVVRPVSWKPDPLAVDLGLALLIFNIILDMFYLDVSVVFSLLASSRPWLATASAAVFFSSIFLELFNVGVPNLMKEVLETNKTGIYTKNLRSLVHRERGWEAFFQLPLTSFALPFLSRSSPTLLLNCLFSMLLSAWGLSTHLYLVLDCTLDVSDELPTVDESTQRSYAEDERPLVP